LTNTIEQDLQQACDYHGHLCAGMVTGVRMVRMACRRLGIDDPKKDGDLVAYAEMARCPADAITALTGLTVGKRRLTIKDYGKMAITIVELGTGRGFRVSPRLDGPQMPQRGEDPVAYYQGFFDDELFTVEEVKVNIAPEDAPGLPQYRATCEECGSAVLDRRDVLVDERVLCRPCAANCNYYEVVELCN
jgi:formylmethanofuran dehydrogenase subunit E